MWHEIVEGIYIWSVPIKANITSQPQLGVTLYKVTHIQLTLLPEDLVFEMETLQIIHNGSAFIVRQTITLH